jgi:hypothetical protein
MVRAKGKDHAMDSSNIDPACQQVRTQFPAVANSVQTLAQKPQVGRSERRCNACAWLLDLNQVALDVKDEQIQVNALDPLRRQRAPDSGRVSRGTTQSGLVGAIG